MDATDNGYPAGPGPAPAPPTADHALIETVWHRLRAVAAAHAAHHGLTAGVSPPPEHEIADLLWWTAGMPGKPPTALLRLPAGRRVPPDIETREAAGTVWAAATDTDAVLRILSSIYLGNLEHRSAGWRRPDADGARPPIDEARIPLPPGDAEDPVSAGSSVEIRTVPNLDGTLSSSPRHVLVLALGWAGNGAIERVEYGREARLRASNGIMAAKNPTPEAPKKNRADGGPAADIEDRLHRAARWAVGLHRVEATTGPR